MRLLLKKCSKKKLEMSFIKMLMCLAEVGWWGCFVDTSVGLARDTSDANAGSS